MNKKFNYNFVEKTIVGSNAAIERANKGLEPEYSELTEMLSVHPEFTVTVKSIKRKEEKKTYNKLTLSRMKDYIETQFSDKEVLSSKLIEFEAIKAIAKTKGALYPMTKKWFLNTYPSFKENAVLEAESFEEQKTLAAAAELLDALVDESDEYEEDAA